MHKINVLVFGPENFNTSLEELKDFFIFNISFVQEKLKINLIKDQDILLIHEGYAYKNTLTEYFKKDTEKIKIFLSSKKNKIPDLFQFSITLPIKIIELNEIIESQFIKKNFNKNSSIKIKEYELDKNEKKLKKNGNFILLTEKEIKLLELLLNHKKSIKKDDILKEVWDYSDAADTHTVETHIYRLRKKIKENFSDDNFILSNKDGYLL